MSIEFPCPQCGRTLRTPEGSEGKRAKCPSCETVTTIPQAAATGSVFDGLGAGTAAGDPFGAPAAPSHSNPFAESAERSPSGGDSYNPYASPYAPTQFETTASGTLSHRKIDFNDVLSDTWKLFSDNMGSLALLALMMAGAAIGAYILMIVLLALAAGLGAAFGAPEIMAAIIVAGMVVGMVAMSYLFSWLGAGITQYTLAISRGQPSSLSEVFTGQRYTLRIFGYALLVHVLLVLGLTFLGVLPGAMLGEDLLVQLGQLAGQSIGGLIGLLFFSLAPFFIVDRNEGLMAAFSSSVNYLGGNRLILFALVLVVVILGVLFSMFTCGLGMLLYLPFFWLFQAVVYLKATGQPMATRLR